MAKRAAGEKPADASTPAAVWTLVDVWTRVVVAMPAVAVTLVDAATRADAAMGVARAEVPLTAAVAAAETPRETAEGGLPGYSGCSTRAGLSREARQAGNTVATAAMPAMIAIARVSISGSEARIA